MMCIESPPSQSVHSLRQHWLRAQQDDEKKNGSSMVASSSSAVPGNEKVVGNSMKQHWLRVHQDDEKKNGSSTAASSSSAVPANEIIVGNSGAGGSGSKVSFSSRSEAAFAGELPPPPQTLPLRRYQSEPSTKPKKRSIFGRLRSHSLEEEERNDGSQPSRSLGTSPKNSTHGSCSSSTAPPFMIRKRSSSLSSSNNGVTNHSSRSRSSNGNSTADKRVVTFRDLPPTPDHHYLKPSPHFSAVGTDLPLGLETDQDLPTLPVPLQRFYGQGTSTCLPGVYPLRRARPVLRTQGSLLLSRRRTGSPDDSETTEGFYDSSRPLNRSNEKAGSSLVRHPAGDGPPGAGSDTETETTASISSQSASVSGGNNNDNNGGRRVQFDPRITVTEYEDRRDRDWYTTQDLESFQCEMLRTAHWYFVRHPEQVHAFQEGWIDPLTNAVRRRALFALPVWNDEDDDESGEGYGDASAGTQSLSSWKGSLDHLGLLPPPQRLHHPLPTDPLPVRQHDRFRYFVGSVKSVLIVDPNPLILDLFRRSLQQLFPEATIATVPFANEALTMFVAAADRQQQQNGFDIVIAEQKLGPLLYKNHKPTQLDGDLSAPTKSSSMEHLAEKAQLGDSFRCQSLQSLEDLAASSASAHAMVTGAQLFERMNEVVPCEEMTQSCTCHPPPLEEAAAASASASPPLQENCNGELWPEIRSANNGNDIREPRTITGDPSPCRCALLIGVSTQPARDAAAFYRAGADLIWGKPPPKMTDRLGAELVEALARKRLGLL